jgi:hypothetical protein
MFRKRKWPLKIVYETVLGFSCGGGVGLVLATDLKLRG